MTARDLSQTPETFTFSNLGELRDWLNMFYETDLTTVLPNDGDLFVLDWRPERLTDGSVVLNAQLRTV